MAVCIVMLDIETHPSFVLWFCPPYILYLLNFLNTASYFSVDGLLSYIMDY